MLAIDGSSQALQPHGKTIWPKIFLRAALCGAMRVGTSPPVRRLPISRMLAALLAAVWALSPALALARSSGGYSRPSSGGYSAPRTPSFGGSSSGSSSGYSRTPSTNGGYSRPSGSGGYSGWSVPQGAGDRGFGQGRSGAALDSYRQQQQQARIPPPSYAPAPGASPSAPPGYSAPNNAPAGWQGAQPRDRYGRFAPYPDRSDWYAQRGWAQPAPGSVFGTGRNFGVWDGLFLGALLSNLTRPGSLDWFRSNQNDPGYQQWRQEAERQSQQNADLKRLLDDLDRRLQEQQGQPKAPGGTTEGRATAEVPDEIAKAPATRTPSIPTRNGGSSWVWLAVLGGAGGLGVLAWKRRPRTASGGSSMSTPIATAEAMVRNKLSGTAYKPSLFRVGMAVQIDPTPFILAGDSLRLPMPPSGITSVAAVGRVTSGQGAAAVQLVRLHLADPRFMLQLHLDAQGQPDECRLFGLLDEVTPADPGEWSAWLDEKEGMIGWPQFQAKDGTLYLRAWVPGDSRISPRRLVEAQETLEGTRSIESQAMLYARPTQAPDPAPPTEYLLASAIQDQGRAWVEIRAGIDVNPATLQLA